MKLRLWHLILLILLAAGAQPASTAVWQWSKTAGTNATADPTINWAEGMAPSAINDSARAMMAQLANWRDDSSGALTTTGSGTAYVLTTNSGYAATPPAGTSVTFVAHTTNGVNASLQLDSGNFFALQSASGIALPAGSLVGGTPYRVSMNAAQNGWVVVGGQGNPYNIPLGGLMPYTLTTTPNSNFVFPAGQCLSTATYNTYWVALGSPGNGSCAGGQFRIIDMSGNVPAGLDTMPGFSAANRLTSSSPGCGTAMNTVGAQCANGSQSHLLLLAEMPSHNHGITDPGHTHPQANAPTGGQAGGFLQQNTSGVLANVVPTPTFPNTTGITINNAGGGGTHSIVQPTVAVTYILRVI